jgi:hypothetical protein
LSDQTHSNERDEADRLLARELEAIPYEPLLPIEKALIVGSLLLGALLLGVLLWASTTFFPIAGPITKG